MDASLEKPGYVYGTAQRVRQAEGSLETRHFVRVYSGAPRLKVYSPDPRVTLVSDYRMTVRDWGPRLQKGTLTLSGAAHRSRQAVATTQADGDPVMLSTPSEPATAERVRSGEADLQRVLVMDGDGERVRLAEGNLSLGWRVPDASVVLIELADYLGDGWVAAIAGSSSLWSSGELKDHERFGETGIDLRPGGRRRPYYDPGDFIDKTYFSVFWTTSTDSNGNPRRISVHRNNPDSVGYDGSPEPRGYSIRLFREDFSDNPDGTIFQSDYVGIDGTIYDAVKVGNQAWLTEALRETKFADGTTIPEIQDGATWDNATSGAWCAYDNDHNNIPTYGRLYNHYVVQTGIINPDYKFPS